MSLFTAAVSTAQDFFGEKLIEKATNTAAAAMDRQKLKERVQDLAERYRPQFEAVSLKEEFDFEGLNAFLQENLFPRVAACFNAPGHDQQEAAKRLLYASACDRAGANTQAKKDAVRHYLELFLEVVENYFLEQVDGQTWFLCGRAVEEVTQTVNAYLQQQTAQITEVIERHDSFAEYIDTRQPAENSDNPFHYRNADLRFYGREQEIEKLNAFLNRSEQVLWMAVVGDGGVGKSKLLYHFCEEIERRSDWKTVWFIKDDCEQVNTYKKWDYPKRLLVVADYAGEMAEQLGDWLRKLKRVTPLHWPKCLRLILLERETPGGTVTPFWSQAFTSRRTRQCEAVQYFQAKPSHIELRGLRNDALEGMVKDYALSIGKAEKLTDDKLTLVLEKAREIDQSNPVPRPLITLFIADAILKEKEPQQWDLTALEKYIINRYREHWKYSVCKCIEKGKKKRKKLYNALQQVLVYATAVGGWDLTELPRPLEIASQRLLDSGWKVLEPLVCAVNENTTVQKWLAPLEPDLVGECYVLDYLNNLYHNSQYCGEATLTGWVQLLWKQEWNFAVFLDRCIHNYCNEERFQALFQNGMEVFQPKAKDEECSFAVSLFAMLLTDLTALQPLEEQERTVGRLGELLKQCSESDRIALADRIALEYAKGLYNLSVRQPREMKKQTINKLMTLVQSHDSDEIALQCAKGLAILIYDQVYNLAPKDAEQTFRDLETLKNEHSNSTEIAIQYELVLVDLSLKDPPKSTAKAIASLEELTERYSTPDGSDCQYDLDIFSLLKIQPQKEKVKTVDNLEVFTKKLSKSDKFSFISSKGLSDLSNK
ncbi:MAG: ATP-binding protein [Clostridiales bacterium]|nr:ATP-binding protein [Clostridiales bacterium]